MTLTLMATAYTSSGTTPPRVQLNVVSTASSPNPLVGSESLTVYRNDPDGQQREVIIPDDSRLSGGIATLFDYHAPFNTPVSYVVAAGSVTADGSLATGYYDYAPSPNTLPSPLAALGFSGDPAGGGWLGNNVSAVGGALRSTQAVKPVTNFQIYAMYVRPSIADPGKYTLRVEFGASNAVGATYNAEISWYTAGGVLTGAVASTSGIDPGSLTVTTTRPPNADWCQLRFWCDNHTAGKYIAITGVTLNSGTSASTVPAPVFIPVDPSPAILNEKSCWLIHPTNPKLSVHLMDGPPGGLQSWGDRTRPNKVGQFDIPGRRTPITINDGQRRAVQSSISVRTAGDAMSNAIDAILDDGGPLLLVTPGTEGWDIKWEWIQPLDTAFKNNAQMVSYPYRQTDIPYVVIDQPVVSSGSLWTWGDIASTYATWGDVTSTYATWGKLSTDTRS